MKNYHYYPNHEDIEYALWQEKVMLDHYRYQQREAELQQKLMAENPALIPRITDIDTRCDQAYLEGFYNT